ncbi:DUF1381 domain-containing protein, partial [Staphylococcus aureus]
RFTVVEAESKEEAKEKYEVQVKRDAVIKLGQYSICFGQF